MAIDQELLAIGALVGIIFLTINTDRKVSDQQLIEGRKGDDTDDKVKARQNQLDDIQKDITKNHTEQSLWMSKVNKFIAISPQPNVYDFTFLAPCPISGLVIYGKNDELVQVDSILNLKKRLSMQKNIDVKFESIVNANHFYKNKEKELSASIDRYIKDKITII